MGWCGLNASFFTAKAQRNAENLLCELCVFAVKKKHGALSRAWALAALRGMEAEGRREVVGGRGVVVVSDCVREC
jgi:hypothetical protein